MSEEKLLKYYGCNSLSEFIDTYLDCETAFDLLRSQFKEIERLSKERSKTYENGLNYFLELQEKKDEIERLNNIIKEVREYIEEAQERDEDKESCSLYIPKLLKILDKGEN